MYLIKILLILIVISQAVAVTDVYCEHDADGKRLSQKNFLLSELGHFFFVHSVYISDKESLKNDSTLHSFDQKRLKTPMVIRYTFDDKFLDLLTNQYDGNRQFELFFDLHELQIGLKFKDLQCIKHVSEIGFYVMTPKAINKEKFELIVLHGCKIYVNQNGRMEMQKVVLLITQNSVDDLDEPIDIMMKQNYEMYQIEYREFVGNRSFCMCDMMVYYLNDCFAKKNNGDAKIGSYWPVIVVAGMIIFIASSGCILERLSKITD
ncbi:unnamed protein product [Diamesa hyperborea]